MQKTKKQSCIFCRIIQKQLPSYTIYQDSLVQAFLDINPSTPGHTLIIPKKHFANLYTIPAKFLKQIILISKKLAKKHKKILKAHGINLLQSNEQIAGQVVPHFHLHLIPRYKNDGLKIGLHKKDNQKNDLEQIFNLLK